MESLTLAPSLPALPDGPSGDPVPGQEPAALPHRGDAGSERAASTATTRRAFTRARRRSTFRRSSARSPRATRAARRAPSCSANLLGERAARACVRWRCSARELRLQQRRPPRVSRSAGSSATLGDGPRRPGVASQSGAHWPRKKSACVGAGPASLACAGTLALLAGHSPVLYEKRALPGGLNTTGVAPYKYAGPRLDWRRWSRILESLGSGGIADRRGGRPRRHRRAELLERPRSRLPRPRTRSGLHAWTCRARTVPESDRRHVSLDRANEDRSEHSFSLGGRPQRAVVVGGGNTAIDAARELAGLGVPSVTDGAYRRSEAP